MSVSTGLKSRFNSSDFVGVELSQFWWLIKQEPTVAVPGSALPAFQEYSGVISDCVCVVCGERTVAGKAKNLEYLQHSRRATLQKPVSSCFLGVVHVCLPENPAVGGLFSLGTVLLCRQSAASPAPGGTAPRSQPGEILKKSKEFTWGCSQAVLCSCGWGTLCVMCQPQLVAARALLFSHTLFSTQLTAALVPSSGCRIKTVWA